ncbi:hypothetical protein [Oxalobacter paraformigenes]|uniref:Helix-turn-helix domain-containing protein n=1 Tax=Oxalobacter paraformigenes TaxID=556268 RepID=C3X4R5_9BURK|nr:hypothetical protein [Oxalobacter paraformigenes]EEO28201.1 hypothetical protein OFAG_01354 [Oxalobacter paraformigenes]
MSKRGKRALKEARQARGGGSFLPFTLLPLQSEQLASLTPYEAKLLFDIMSQWRLGNNGDQSAAWALMQKRGWRSKETLGNALKGLLEKGFIVLTRQGGRNKCSLYGLGWLAIDQCSDKLDIQPTMSPVTKNWRKYEPLKN